jgi:hypothetical protein
MGRAAVPAELASTKHSRSVKWLEYGWLCREPKWPHAPRPTGQSRRPGPLGPVTSLAMFRCNEPSRTAAQRNYECVCVCLTNQHASYAPPPPKEEPISLKTPKMAVPLVLPVPVECALCSAKSSQRFAAPA